MGHSLLVSLLVTAARSDKVLGGALPLGDCLALLVLGGALPPGDCLALLVRHKLAHLAGTDVIDSVEMPEEVLDTLLLVESCQAIKS